MGYTVLDCKPKAVDSGELLTTMSPIAAKRGGNASCCSTKVAIPLLSVHMTCWLWVVLLTVLLSSSGAYSAKDTSRSEECRCRYDLTSIAVLSCVQPDGGWRPPSQTCCNALLHATDQIPANGESGACCLCRYMKEKVGPPGLATAYVLCKGQDKHIISKWSSFPITNCSAECRKTSISSVDMGSSANEDSPVVRVHGGGKGKVTWIVVDVFIVIGLICFSYSRWFKAAANASVQRRTPSQEEGDLRAGHRRSVVPSSSAKLKERRFSSS